MGFWGFGVLDAGNSIVPDLNVWSANLKAGKEVSEGAWVLATLLGKLKVWNTGSKLIFLAS